MRKLDLAQRKGSNREKVNDPVVSHYDRKMDYALPKIRLDAISKKRTQIEYTNEFETKCVMITTYESFPISLTTAETHFQIQCSGT
jgi:hypothetical protein